MLVIVGSGAAYYLASNKTTDKTKQTTSVTKAAEKQNSPSVRNIGEGFDSSSANEENPDISLATVDPWKDTGQKAKTEIEKKMAAVISSMPVTSQAVLNDFKKALEAADPLAAFGKDRIQNMTADEIKACLDMANSIEPSAESMKLLQEIVKRWAVLDVRTAADYAASVSSLRVRAALMNSVVQTWAATDVKAAAAYVGALSSQRTKNAVMGTLISAWSVTDPQSALAWLKDSGNVDHRTAGQCISTIFNSIAKQDMNQAISQALSLTDGDMKRAAMRTLVDAAAKNNNTQVLLAAYGQMTAGDDKTFLSQAIVENMARYQPSKAIEWISNTITDSNERDRAIGRLLSTWGNDEPALAANWLTSQLADGDLRRSQLGRVMESWAQDNPDEAAKWLSQYPASEQTDQAARSLAREMARTNPQAAAGWAESITDVNLRNRAIQEVAFEWMSKDAEKAKAYITASSLPDNTKTMILERSARGGNWRGGGRRNH